MFYRAMFLGSALGLLPYLDTVVLAASNKASTGIEKTTLHFLEQQHKHARTKSECEFFLDLLSRAGKKAHCDGARFKEPFAVMEEEALTRVECLFYTEGKKTAPCKNLPLAPDEEKDRQSFLSKRVSLSRTLEECEVLSAKLGSKETCAKVTELKLPNVAVDPVVTSEKIAGNAATGEECKFYGSIFGKEPVACKTLVTGVDKAAFFTHMMKLASTAEECALYSAASGSMFFVDPCEGMPTRKTQPKADAELRKFVIRKMALVRSVTECELYKAVLPKGDGDVPGCGTGKK